MKPPNVIFLPEDKRKKAKDRTGHNRIKNIDGIKYFTELQIKMLRRLRVVKLHLHFRQGV